MAATHWTSECILAEYRDLQANAMAVDYTGHLALLAGRRSLAILSLNKPLESVKKIPRQSKWEVGAAQWNPHPSHAQYFVTACNQRADVSTWVDSTHVQQGFLKAHTRVISDLDWSPADPNILATCSVDTFTYLWDIREPRKYTTSLQAVAGASQVKWNKVNQNLLGTTHDGAIHIWDPRQSKKPVQYIAAHLSKIHGLDWSPKSQYHLATSSQDCTVKLWDVTSPRQAELKLTGGSPVWRARYTPFGKGLVTVVVPQLRRGENSLFLWHLDDPRQALHTFVGHTDVVLEFQWRKPEEGCLDYQLVTWSKDQSLRLWKIDTQLQKYCGAEVEDCESIIIPTPADLSESSPQPTALTPAVDDSSEQNGELVNQPLNSLSSTPPGPGKREEVHLPQQPKTLQHELKLVNFYIPNVELQEMDALKRVCRVSAISGDNVVELTMRFPETYPNNAPPNFQFGPMTNLQTPYQTKIIKTLRDTSIQQVKHNRSCIEPCLRQLICSLDALTAEMSDKSNGSSFGSLTPRPGARQRSEFHHMFGNLRDKSVPFPRTSGARFCGMGLLVCFTRRTDVAISRRVHSMSEITPRDMSVLTSPFPHPSTRPTAGPATFMFSTVGRSPPSDSSGSLSKYYNSKAGMERKLRPRPKSRPKEPGEGRNKEKNSGSPPKKQAKTGPVIIYDTSCLLPVNKQLAENYVLDTSNIPAMCRTNAGVAAGVGRKDLAQVWSLAALASCDVLKPENDPDKGSPWAAHPFGRKLLKSLIDHYCSLRDVQTLAMLCCAFGSNFDPQMAAPVPSVSSSSSVSRSSSEYQVHNNNTFSIYNAYHTIHPTDTSVRGWTIRMVDNDDDRDDVAAVSKMRRSNSWSEIYDESRFPDSPPDPCQLEEEQHKRNMKLLDISRTPQYDQFKKAYADMLYRWELVDQRALVLKYLSSGPLPHKAMDFSTKSCGEFTSSCQNFGADSRAFQCYSCIHHVLLCVICHIRVRGVSCFCMICGHGGHSTHMQEWFRCHDVCASGCGCRCLENNLQWLDPSNDS